jgi:hypothetical protein
MGGSGGKQPRQRRDGSALPDGTGPGKRDRKVYVRNQRLNAPQVKPTSSNLADGGWAAARTGTTLSCGELLGRFRFAGREATPNACGVGVAMLQGKSWTPILPTGTW